MESTDPYAAYGGSASSSGADPYASYGGKATAPAQPDSSNSAGEGTYRMVGPQGQVVSVPFSKVRAAQDSKFAVVPSDSSRYNKDVSGAPNSTQQFFDANTKTDPNASLLETGLKSVASGFAAPFVHPVQAAKSIVNAGVNDVKTASIPGSTMLTNMASGVKQDYQAGGAGYAATKFAGQLTGQALLSEVGGEVVKGAPEMGGAVGSGVKTAVTATGQAAEDAGVGLMNKTVGTLKADFKRGANPGRGYLETGNGPSVSMRSIADKASTALDTTGTALGDAYKAADATGDLVPVNSVKDAIMGPMQDAYKVATGPGAPKNLLQDLEYHAGTFDDVLAQGEKQGGFTPSQVWELKKTLAKATGWSDPTQVGLKSVAQEQVGSLSGVLKDTVPETAQLNQNYMDLLKLEGRATERANTGSRPLTAHIYKAGMTAAGAAAGALDGHALLGVVAGSALDSVPFKTTLASGLYKGGQLLKGLAGPAESAAVEGEPAQNLIGNGANAETSDPQSVVPPASNPTTGGPERWAADGAARVAQHISIDGSSGLTKADIADALTNPKTKRMIINASDLTPGSAAMKNLVKQIRSTLKTGATT